MLNINCFTWNKYLPEQELIEGTCSFHSIRNADYMIKILKNIKINSSYTDNIKKNIFFKKMTSKKQLDIDLKYLIGNLKNLRLNGKEIKKIIKDKNLSDNIFPVYYSDCKSEFYSEDILKIKEVKRQKSYIISFILFKKRLNMISHWCPIIIQKNINNINVHIVDSYNMTWWGDPRINSLIKHLYPGPKNISCSKDNIKGDLFYISKTIFHTVVYFVAIYLFIYAIFYKFKLIQNT